MPGIRRLGFVAALVVAVVGLPAPAHATACGLGVPVASALAATPADPGGGWLAGDVNHSVALGGGRALWLYGDTFFGGRSGRGFAPGSRFDRNSALTQHGTCAAPLARSARDAWVGAPGSPGYVLVDQTGGVFTFGSAGFHGSVPALREQGKAGQANVVAGLPTASVGDGYLWPTDGFAHGDRTTVFFNRFVQTGPGILDFDHAGGAVADLATRGLDVLRVSPLPHHDPKRTWGSSVVVDGGWAYAFAWQQSSPDSYVARFRPGRATEPWEFWTGAGWQRGGPGVAAPILRYGAWNNVTFSRHPERGFLALAKDHEFWGTDVIGWWAPRPEGPWTALGALAQAPAGNEEVTYQAVAHPEMSRPGSLLVSWNVNGTSLDAVTSGRVAYGPRFLEIPVPRPPG